MTRLRDLPPLLFTRGDLRLALEKQAFQAAEAARTMNPDRVLSSPTEDLVEELVGTFWVNPLKLLTDSVSSSGAQDVNITIETRSGRSINVDGTLISWRVPYTGDRQLFDLKASRFSMNPPRATVSTNERAIVVTYEARSPVDPAAAKAALAKVLDDISEHIAWQQQQIDEFNGQLHQQMSIAVEKRREKVLADRALDAYLDVPIVAREHPAPTFSVDPPKRHRKSVQPHPPDGPTTEPFAPEPGISDGGFAEILATIKSVTRAVERYPSTFAGMPEESLRDVLLVVLNNQFGPASGETFSRNGKTDILIPYGDTGEAVFIAECKWWRGPSKFRSAIDQVLSYLVWRDTKAALVLFIGQPDVTSVLRKARDEVESHAQYKRTREELESDQATRFVLHHQGDRARELQLALVPVPVGP